MPESIISRGISILANEGPVVLANKIIQLTKNKIKTSKDPKYWMYRIKGERKLCINNQCVVSDISNMGVYRETEFICRNEVEILEDMMSEAKSGDIFLDIGANIGIHALFVEKIVDETVAIEPHPVNDSVFLTNKEKNDSNIDVYACAFSDSSGYLKLLGPRGGGQVDGSASLSSISNYTEKPNGIFVRVENGDEFIVKEKISDPTIVKIDVEGAEENVINGLTKTIQKPQCRVLYCEIHEDRSDYESIVSKLKSFGYTIEIIQERKPDKVIKAKKPDQLET